MAELVTVLRSWRPVVFKVAPRAFDAIVESLALHVIELIRERIPLRRWRRRRSGLESRSGSRPASQMRHGAVIAATEPIAKGFALWRRHAGMAIDLVIVNVRRSAHIEVMTRGFDAFMKTLALNVVEFLWRNIPWPLSEGPRRNGCSQGQSNCENCKSVEMHRSISFWGGGSLKAGQLIVKWVSNLLPAIGRRCARRASGHVDCIHGCASPIDHFL